MEFLKQVSHDRLYADIKNNLERYRTGNFDDLITAEDCFTSNELLIDFDALKSISGNYKNDTKNALLIDKAIGSLSPHAARDKRLWAYFTHTYLLKYTRKRFPLPDKSKGDDRTVKHIITHFFANTGRNFERDNAVARLWWVVFMCKRAPHIPLEKALRSIYLYQDPIVQLLGRPTSAISTNIFTCILEKMVDSLEGDNAFLKERHKYNHPFLKELSSFGGHNLLDALSVEESREVMQLIDKKILNSVNTKTTQNLSNSNISDNSKGSDTNLIEENEEEQEGVDSVVVIRKEDQTLRDKLVEFSFEIGKKHPNTDEHERILNDAMLMQWLAYKPRNFDEYLVKIRKVDRQGIAPDEIVYIDNICEIIDEHM